MLRTVAKLTSEWLGLEGVKRVLDLEHQVYALRERVAELQAELAAAHHTMSTTQNLPAVIAGQQVTAWRKRQR